MRSFSFIIALLFALISSAYAWPELHLLEARKGGKNGTRGNSVHSQCRQIARLTKITELAANQTKLDAKLAAGKLNQTEIDAIKAKAAKATTTLATMTSNATLVSECAVISAHQKVVGQCQKLKQLTKLANLANNVTAKAAWVAKKKLNDTQLARFDEKIANASTKLTEMQSNTTLTDLCTTQNQQKGTNNGECKF